MVSKRNNSNFFDWRFFHFHRCRWHRWCTLSCEHLHEFSKKFKTALTVYSGAWGKLIHVENLKSKISWHCPFNAHYCGWFYTWHLLPTQSQGSIFPPLYCTCLQKFCLWRTRCVCYLTLSLTPRGLNLCQIVMWNYIVNMIMYMYKTGCSARLENDRASGCFPRFCGELCTACCQFGQNKNYVSYVLCINSQTIFPRSCNWPCTLKNPCCGGWKITVGP